MRDILEAIVQTVLTVEKTAETLSDQKLVNEMFSKEVLQAIKKGKFIFTSGKFHFRSIQNKLIQKLSP